MYPDPRITPLRSVYAGSAGKFGGQVFWCPQKGHKLQQNGYNRLGTPTEQNMGSGYELLATRCKVEGG